MFYLLPQEQISIYFSEIKVDDSPLRNNRLVEKENRQIYPACLPRVKEGYKDGTFFVAGWGLLKSRIVEVQYIIGI